RDDGTVHSDGIESDASSESGSSSVTSSRTVIVLVAMVVSSGVLLTSQSQRVCYRPSLFIRLDVELLAFFCGCRCALTKVLAHFVDLERGLACGILGSLAQQFNALTGFQ